MSEKTIRTLYEARHDERQLVRDEETGVVRLFKGEIKPDLDLHICVMCGRTLLTGETVERYTKPDGVKLVVVCRVCRQSARDTGYSKAS
ncbi:MAG: hypothetical protein IBX61_00710 [Thermoleophilia bacterium]|nr:hypothetical protein [Thermoleophilia bacterium]